jgi:hypothetical protein
MANVTDHFYQIVIMAIILELIDSISINGIGGLANREYSYVDV